jgi:late competence protein required for DNA uptake (superfamily II DNA/RNA helicase)
MTHAGPPTPSKIFVERKSVIAGKVLENLAEYQFVIICRVCGVGKTELAAQVVGKARGLKMYETVIWVTLAAGIKYELVRISCELETVTET